MPEGRGLRWLLWMALALVLIVLDQWSKGLASEQLQYGQPQELLPVLNLTLQHNTGAAFSFLSDAGGWQRWFFTIVALIVSGVLCIWLARLKRQEWLLALGLACILGGAIGNLWDRLILGYVVDFVSVHYRNAYFPAFNLADAAITVGAALLILDSIRAARRGDKND